MEKSFFEKTMQSYGITAFPNDATLAMAYIPFQQTEATYIDENNSLNAGTVFPMLNKPFEMGSDKQ